MWQRERGAALRLAGQQRPGNGGHERPRNDGHERAVASACRTSTCPWIGEAGEDDRWGPAQSRGSGSNGFEPNSNFKRIQIILKPSKVWMIQKPPS
jgi:hypothetical protein